MIYVGIDVSKNKHDCFIVHSDGTVIKDVFTIPNSIEGFKYLIDSIPSTDEIVKVGLEATGHYSINIANFLNSNGYPPIILNPLQTSLFRKALTLRKTKTDKVDAKCIASMLSNPDLKPHSNLDYQILELKSLTRHRKRLREQSSKLKVSLNRLVEIMFPEITDCLYSINQKSTMAILYEFPSLKLIADAHLTKFTNILKKNSKGKYSKAKAIDIKNSAKNSIGSDSRALSFELKQTIRLINDIEEELILLDNEIKSIMENVQSPILTIPGISYNLGSIILSEIGDIHRFSSSSKLVAFAGLDPSTYQSGNFRASNVSMVKRGSPYLRWALLQAARLISMRDNNFKNYYQKKRSEGKCHNVAITHVAKKLIRVLHYLLINDLEFVPQ
ncbi:IS110 family transposase [Miniphocaeibacter halophilus]|uniref:IS110 family transposase n=2 Tax=Miniphocaeibacter halophilus TaxID=2931922 RepID=A0AC61MT99_9FIRM|nr:IS110 family transposase [Miniphocaeibacter halophilus]QQK08115.1 IS110 family transposase [Miniphocaeibacter halophilus]QQK08781.1 IS110 family transposase [Miniphocaeibacter halophilus]